MNDSAMLIKNTKAAMKLSSKIFLFFVMSASLSGQTATRDALERIIVPSASFNGLELSKVAYVLSSFSNIYGNSGKEIEIRAKSSDEDSSYDVLITYNKKNVSLRRVIEEIAEQTNSEVKYLPDLRVVIAAPPKPLTLEQKAQQVRDLNPDWNTHLSDYELLLAYLKHHPKELKTFEAPASMKSAIEPEVLKAELREKELERKFEEQKLAKLRQEEQRLAKLRQEANEARWFQDEAKRSKLKEDARTSLSQQSVSPVKSVASKNSDEDITPIIIVIGIIVGGIFLIPHLLSSDESATKKEVNNHKPAPKRSTGNAATKKATARKTPTKKTTSKKVTAKKKVASKSTTKTAPGSHINDESHNPGNSGGIEAQISHLQQLFDRGQISEAEMDKKIRKILTGSS